MSYDAAWRTGVDAGKDERLIRRLWRDGHTSPFEAVTLTFEVKAPIFVFRQWHRHRTWSFNELSARYRELPTEYYAPPITSIGVQSKDNKQGRSLGGEIESDVSRRRSREVEEYHMHCERAFELYRNLLSTDWPRELARMVLPASTYSHMFATVNLLNLFRFLTLRTHEHAQMEIQLYARALADLTEKVAPVCMSAWRDYKWRCLDTDDRR